MKTHRFSTLEDFEVIYRAGSVEVKVQCLAEGSVQVYVYDLDHVGDVDGDVGDPDLRAIRGDVDIQHDELALRPLLTEFRNGGPESADQRERVPQERFHVEVVRDARCSTRLMRSAVSEAGHNGLVREHQIVIDRTGDVGVEDQAVIGASVMPITRDHRARRRRLQGLREAAPALRNLIDSDQHFVAGGGPSPATGQDCF